MSDIKTNFAETIIIFILTFCAVVAFNVFFSKTDNYKLTTAYYTLVKNENHSYHLYLSGSIGNSSAYTSLTPNLLDMSDKDTIYLHLAGSGGSIEGMQYLQGVLKGSHSKVISVIDGEVDSAHAVLAIAFDKTIINAKDSTIFFHISSTTNEAENICHDFYKNDPFATDRGISAYDKCVMDTVTTYNCDNQVFLALVKPYLTAEEYNQLVKGYDIILPLNLFQKRMDALKGDK